MKYYVIFDGWNWLTVDGDGTVICGKGFGTRLPYWDDGQAFSAYYQVEGCFEKKSDAVRFHKQLIFSFAARQSRAMRRRVRHDEIRRIRA